MQVGTVRLHEHQQRAIDQIERALDLYGGVLLADTVGLGKTYVALAVSRDCGDVVVVAPAVLRANWMESAARAGAAIRFVSTESLSRAGPTCATADFVIVDEAHHFRNPRTRRYKRLAQLTETTRILLLTATPVHNREGDLCALLALFLGAGAGAPAPETIARCVIRREHSDVHLVLPRLGRLRRLTIAGSKSIAQAILELPPPLPARDEGDAAGLVQLGLLHLWSSSDAALIRGIRRRLAAGMAMREALAVGRAPARRELRSWLASDDAVQLGFTELLIEPVVLTGSTGSETLDTHMAALRRLLSLVRAGYSRDALRAVRLRQLRTQHRMERVLAFSSYAATVHSLRKELMPDGEVAAVTAHGGWIASGRTSREEVLRMFRAPAHRRERVALLLATDLLSEGLNLQEASVVVHLDLPWTAARLEQRVGRARRPGSAGNVVRSYAFVQPEEIERLIGKERLISSKARTAGTAVGAPAYGDTRFLPAPSPSRASEDARRILKKWRHSASRAPRETVIRVSAVTAAKHGFLALLHVDGAGVIIAGFGHAPCHNAAPGRNQASNPAPVLMATADPGALREALAAACGTESCVDPRQYLAARRAMAQWLANQSARDATLATSAPSREVRAILHRLEAALANAPLHRRTGMAAQVSRIRKTLSGRLTRGLEIAISESGRTIIDDGQLMTALDTLLAEPHVAYAAGDGEPIAVLLLDSNSHCDAAANATSSERRA